MVSFTPIPHPFYIYIILSNLISYAVQILIVWPARPVPLLCYAKVVVVVVVAEVRDLRKHVVCYRICQYHHNYVQISNLVMTKH